MTVAVDLGSSAVKVATDGRSAVLVARAIDPELAARVGTTVPLVRREGRLVLTQAAHEAYVRAVATALDGTTAESVAIVTPDWWTKRGRDMVAQTLEAHEAGRFQLVSPAVAAVRAAAEKHRLPTTVAVLDIGAESSSTTIVTADDGGHRVVGRPAVLHGQAGNHIDRRLMQHVLGWLGDDIHGAELTQAEIAAAGQSLQKQVKAAKELLSTRPVATLTPELPGANVELRLVRSEFDEVARETVDAIVAMLKANIVVNAPDGVEAVLLTGGSVSIPLVTQVISVELGLPVILENDPATLAVRGAATVEVPAPPRRRSWLPRRRVGAGRLAFDLKNAPAPQSEPYVDVLPQPAARLSPEPQGRHPASDPAEVVPDSAAPEAGGERHPGRRLENFIDISRRQAAAIQSVPELQPVHLVVETEDASRSSPSARWASAPEADSTWSSARRVYVDDEGQFRLKVNDRDHEIDMGTELASTSVTLLLIGLHVFVTLSENGALLRELRLDPEHDFRPE
jgi:actin-like ATPase involved in cell morphogenesis